MEYYSTTTKNDSTAVCMFNNMDESQKHKLLGKRSHTQEHMLNVQQQAKLMVIEARIVATSSSGGGIDWEGAQGSSLGC